MLRQLTSELLITLLHVPQQGPRLHLLNVALGEQHLLLAHCPLEQLSSQWTNVKLSEINLLLQ